MAGDADFPDAKAGEPRKVQQLNVECEPVDGQVRRERCHGFGAQHLVTALRVAYSRNREQPHGALKIRPLTRRAGDSPMRPALRATRGPMTASSLPAETTIDRDGRRATMFAMVHSSLRAHARAEQGRGGRSE